MAYFTYLWKKETWSRKKALAAAGCDKLDYAAGDRFKSAGVSRGSTVFLVTVDDGELYLGGYIKVSQVLDRAKAALYLCQPEASLWQAKEYIVAEVGTEARFRDNVLVPSRLSRKLELDRNGGFVHPKVDGDGKIDRQTFRNVRKLYRGAESVLFSLVTS